MFIKIGHLKPDNYKGIEELAAYRLHSDIFGLVKPCLKNKMHVIDFGCGQGAFSQRLIDSGLIVDGCDINTGQIKAEINRKFNIDLNNDLDPSLFPEKYDLAVALEIVEHLHDPWKFLTGCLSILKPGGILVLSTPNISNFVSRLRFLMRGSLWAFEKADLKHGQITPLSFVQLENMWECYGLEVLKKGYAGPVPLFHLSGFSFFSLLRNTLLPILFPFMAGPKNGRSLVYILRKNG